MLLNCGVGEDSWESLGLQGDQTSQSWRKSLLNIHWKDWCWSWSSNTLQLWCTKNWLIRKDPDAGQDWRQEEKGTTKDEMVGWHHQLNRHEFEKAPGDSEGQGSLACCKESGVTKSQTWLSNWKTATNQNKTLNSNLILHEFIIQLGWQFRLVTQSKVLASHRFKGQDLWCGLL